LQTSTGKVKGLSIPSDICSSIQGSSSVSHRGPIPRILQQFQLLQWQQGYRMVSYGCITQRNPSSDRGQWLWPTSSLFPCTTWRILPLLWIFCKSLLTVVLVFPIWRSSLQISGFVSSLQQLNHMQNCRGLIWILSRKTIKTFNFPSTSPICLSCSILKLKIQNICKWGIEI